MAKALKVVGTIAVVAGLAVVTGGAALGLGLSLATTAFGVSAGALLAAGTVLGAASSLLSPKPKAPAVSASATNRLTADINVRTPRTDVFGYTAMATDVRDQEWSAGQTYLDRFIVVASHRVHSIDQIWFDDKLAWSGGTAQGEFAGYLTVTPILEGSAENAINLGARMGASRRYTGCAYVHLRYKLTGNSKKAESPFAGSISSRITIVGGGGYVYDPRLDSTVLGGSGACRADDQATWVWTDAQARNPALVMLRRLLGWRINGRLAVGMGLPAGRIDLPSFITAANICDEPVTNAGGVSEPRYRADGIFSEGDDPSMVLENLKAAMNAVLDDVDGRIRVSVLHNDLAAPIGTLTTDDVLGEFSWVQSPPLSDTVNVIRGGYTDPSAASLYQLVDYPEVRIDSPDGIDRAQTVNLACVQSPGQAQRLVKLRLGRAQYAGTFTAVFQATAWKFQKGDVIRFSFFPLGWENKLFRIADMAIQLDGTVPMMLREEHPAIYAAYDDERAAVAGAAPTTYDPSLWPVLQAVEDAALTAAWPNVADPEGTKPADNATNSADPASPFGPGGTVADELTKRAALAALFRTLDEETIPAIDAAVGEANDRIAQARTALEGADAVLDQRITALAVEGSGYDDTGLRARVEEVAQAGIAGDVVLASRTGLLEAASGVNSSLRNRYAVFSAWPDGQEYPSGWSAWDQGLGPERVAGSVGRFAARSNNAGLSSAGMQTNWLTDPGLADVPPGTSWVLYADITLVAGQFGNQGAHVNFYNGNGVATGAGFNLHFRDPDGLGTDNPGVAGRRYQMVRLLTEGGPGTRHAWLYAMQAWSPLGPQRNAVIDWHAIGIRQATPEEVKAQKADAALNAPGGVLARLATSDATLADLPNQYAAVARTEALEAQVNLAADSGLQRTINARIEDRATTIADAKAGAVSQTVAQLRSEYNGTAATVGQQAGTLVDVNYRTRAYWRAVVDAGNNRAGITMYADSNNGAGVNIVGDVAIDGNLTLNGTLGLGKLARSQYSTRGRWAGATPPTTPGRGQLAILMDQLLGPVGEGGVFAVQSATGVTSNEGQTVVNQAGNKRFTYDSMGGGVFCQLVNVATGANMIVFGGNQPLTEIENVWGAVSVFVRWYVYNSAQDGETTFDPESGMSYQSLAATYTASAPSGSVKWTFV